MKLQGSQQMTSKTQVCKRGKAGKKPHSVQICLRFKARQQILDTAISGSKYHIRRGVLFQAQIRTDSILQAVYYYFFQYDLSRHQSHFFYRSLTMQFKTHHPFKQRKMVLGNPPTQRYLHSLWFPLKSSQTKPCFWKSCMPEMQNGLLTTKKIWWKADY